jgi:hypothetical protein
MASSIVVGTGGDSGVGESGAVSSVLAVSKTSSETAVSDAVVGGG